MEKKNFKSKFFCLALSILLFNGFSLNVQADEQTIPKDDNSDSKEESNIINTQILGVEEENTESEIVTDDGIKFEGTYDSLDEAENQAESKEDEYYDNGYENVKSEIEKIEDTEGKDVQIGVDFVTTEDYEIGLSKEEALSLKIELEQDETVSITISEGYEVIDYVQEEKIVEKSFDTEAQALEYIEGLKEQGYRVDNIEFTNNTEEEIITQKFESEEEANKFLEEFKKTHTSVDATITEEYDSTEDTEIEKIEGTTGFESKEEAESEAERIENSVSEDEKYYLVATVRGPQAIREETKSQVFNSKEEALAYLEELKNNNYEIVSYNFVNDTEEQNRVITDMDEYNSDIFDTEEEAQNALDAFIKKYNNASGNISKVYDSSENIEGNVEKLEEGYLTEEEAQRIANSIKVDENTDADYYVVTSVTGKELVETTTLAGRFETKEEADKFVQDLKNQGYTIIGYQFVNETKTDDMSLVKTYETKKEAEDALEDFKNNCDKDSVSGEITEEYNSSKDTVDQTVIGTEGYISKEEAESEAERIENSVSEDEKYYFIATVRGPEAGNQTEQISEQLSSEEDIDAYLESLKAQGYEVISYSFVHDTKEEDRILTDMNEYNTNRFETEEQAQVAEEAFRQKYNNSTVTITPVYDSSENESEEEKTSDNWYSTYEKALEEANKLAIAENTDKTYYFIATVSDPETTTSNLQLEGNFDSEEEALKLISDLESQGYIISNYTFVNLTEIREVSLTDTFEEKIQAEEALKEFENKYDNVEADEIEEIYDEKDNTVNSTYTTEEYLTEKEAQDALDTEISKSDHDYLITGTIQSEKEEKNVESGALDSEILAEEYILSLQNQGYDVTNLTKEKLVLKDGYWQTVTGVKIQKAENISSEEFSYGHFHIAINDSYTLLNQDGTQTIVKGNMILTSVIVNNKSYSVPTKTQWDNLIKKYEYRINGVSVNNNTTIKITGYIQLENSTEKLYFETSGLLNEADNICKNDGKNKGFDIDFTDILIYEDKVFVETNITEKFYVSGTINKTLYHADITKYNKGYDYKVNAKGTETVTLDSGYMTGTKTLNKYFIKTQRVNKGYDYVVDATGTETVTLDSGVLTGEKVQQYYYVDYTKYNKGYDYKVNLKGKKTITLDSGNISGTKELYKYFVNKQVIQKGYDHKVNATGTETITLESGNLTAKVNKLGYYVDTVKIAKGYDYVLNVTGTKTLESGKLSADTELDIYKTVYDIDYTKAVPIFERQYFDKYKVTVTADEMEIENPKTADNTLSFIYLQILSLIGLVYSGIKLKIRK